MTENTHRVTAKIYQFPSGGRDGPNARHEALTPVSEVILEVTAKVAIGGSWYHEKAVREAEQQKRKN